MQIAATAAGDTALAARYKEKQKEQAILNQGLLQAQGLPGSTPIETSQTADPEVEIYRQFYNYMEHQAALDKIVEYHDFRGMTSEFDLMVIQPYTQRNKEPLLQERPGMTDAERIQMMQQLEPVIVDPAWAANMRQRLVKLDLDGKKVDPDFSVFKDPRTARVANWIARETGVNTPGFMQSGEQKYESTGQTRGDLREFGSGVVDFNVNVLAGIVNVSAMAIKAIAGEAYGLPWAVATNFTEDENGNLVNNGGKVPGFVQTIAAVNARVLGQNVREYVARVDKAIEFERMNLNWFERIEHGASHVMGMGFGMGPPVGAALSTGKALAVGGRIGGGKASLSAFGKSVEFKLPSYEAAGLLNQGLMRLAVSGASPRMVKLAKVMGGTAGAGFANGLLESAAFGRTDGYVKSFVHGMAMAPVLMTLGAMGRKSESLFLRKKMPAFLARAASGGIEGFGFAALEHAQTGALWKMMQDPSGATWEIYAKNMLGFAIFKGAFGRSVIETPEFGDAQGHQLLRQQGRERLAEEVSRADEGELLRAADETIVGKAETEARVAETKGVPRETVEGKEPTVGDFREGKEQIKGKLPSPETQMELSEFGILSEGERVLTKDVLAKRGQKDTTQGFDPLEDPNFMQRPEAERRAILERRDAGERRRTAEQEFGGEERRQGDRREMLERRKDYERSLGKDVEPPAPAPEAPRLTAKEMAAEVQRIRAEGFTPENRQRINELLARERGRLTEGWGDVYRQVGEKIPTDIGPRRRPRQFGEEPASREDLEARVTESGIPREALRELGDISRARRAARSPQEAAKLWRRQLDLEQELDALEMSQDPVMNATMREALRRREVEELDMANEDVEAAVAAGEVDPLFGERFGPESMRAPANPHRQQENLLRPGEKPVRASDIINVLKGRPGFPGVRILGQRLGRIPGSAVQVAIRAGRIAGRGTMGVFKIYENLTRTKEGMDLVVALHEWSHAMQRQVQIGEGNEGYSKGVRKWLKGQPDDVLNDMATILRSYPGAAKLPMWAIGAEAWAEWHARNLLGDATLRPEVPALSRVMDAWLKNQTNLRPQYQEVMELVDIYKRQGARLRLRESIQRGMPRKQGSMIEQVIGKGDTTWDWVVKSFFDDMHLLKKSQRKWLQISGIDASNLSVLDDPARMYDIVFGTASKQAESFIQRGTHNLALERTGESLEAIFNDVGGDLKGTVRNEKTIDFIDYVVATRAIDLIEKGKKQTLPLSDYLQAKKELIAANPEFAGMAKRLKVWTDALLDLVAEAGNLQQKDVQRMKDYSVAYLPFVRAMEGTVTQRGPRGVAEKGNAIKSMKGDTREISDPMQAMFDLTTTMIAKAHQQMVIKSLYKMMLRADVGGLATRIDRKNVPSNFRLDQILRQIEKPIFDKMGELAKEGMESGDPAPAEAMETMREAFDILGELGKAGELSDDLITLFGQKLMPYGESGNILAYTPRLTVQEIADLPRHAQGKASKWNGQMQWLEVDAPAYTALMGLDQPVGPTFMDNAIMKWVFGKPAKVLRYFATDANPPFMAANAVRDIASAPVFDREGRIKPFGGMKRFIEGAAILASNDPYKRSIADMYDASGAGSASIYNQGVRREMRGQVISKLGAVRETIVKASDKWTKWMAGPESFIRVHEFKRVYEAALKAGKSKLEAAMEALEGAKEITVNFSRAGSLARAYNQMTPYFSASFAGQRKLLRALTGMEGTNDAIRGRMQAAALANGLVGITVPSLAVWALVKDEDWYRDLPEWRKRHFLNMRWPGSNNIISLPLPFELGSIFGTMPQILMDKLTDNNPIGFVETLAESMVPYLRGAGSLLPVGAKGLLEVASGYDFFTRRELTPYYIEQNNPPAEQMRPGTTRTAQEAFKLLQNVGVEWLIDNPIELEQLIANYTAGASTSFARWVDETMSLKDHPGIKPGIGATYGAFLNRFAKQTVHGASRAVDQFYNEVAPRIEQKARHEKTRTPALRRALRMIQRDKDRMSDIRRQVRAGEMSRADGDRLIFEIASDALEREGK